MEERRIYLSHAPEDRERVRPLRTFLEVLGMTVITRWPRAIADASSFVACFGDRWDDDELRAAVGHAAQRPPEWMVLVRMTPSPLPQIPGLPPSAPVVEFDTAMPAVQERGSSTVVFTADEYAADEHLDIINVDGGTVPPGTAARSEITMRKAAVGSASFINVRKQTS